MNQVSMNETPKANRIHIGFFGRCNAGKSSLINMLTGQPVSLVSEVAGTTTDPVSKAMEILPLGPVMIIDTAGIDDTSELGALRINKTREMLPKMNMAVYVLRTAEAPTDADLAWLDLLERRKLPTLLVLNEETISGNAYMQKYTALAKYPFLYAMADVRNQDAQAKILQILGKLQPLDEEAKGLLEGLVKPKDLIVLVCPIDSAAPKGRLILPQVQMIREVLDYHAMSLVTQTEDLAELLASLGKKPKLVITDSQAFEEVAAIVPDEIPMTSFSILMARFKGDLKALMTGVKALENLQSGSKVLISEGCTHHRQCDDIGTVKIPRWLMQAGYKDLNLEWTSGGAFPENLGAYDLVIHCGACMLTRREVLRRIEASVVQGVPIINYGVLIAFLHGILTRALTPFTEELSE